ncbi:MAG: PadR family transcriptional regulator [Chloroflexota bacterium]|nr:PadR family transcriptional regulator [Chloroflexota bacterium]
MNTKKIREKLMKGLLELVVLQLIERGCNYGYKIIVEIRKVFGANFGPSTIYPLLNSLEDDGYLISNWDTSSLRPKKIYRLSEDGEKLLKSTENSLVIIYRKLGLENDVLEVVI